MKNFLCVLALVATVCCLFVSDASAQGMGGQSAAAICPPAQGGAVNQLACCGQKNVNANVNAAVAAPAPAAPIGGVSVNASVNTQRAVVLSQPVAQGFVSQGVVSQGLVSVQAPFVNVQVPVATTTLQTVAVPVQTQLVQTQTVAVAQPVATASVAVGAVQTACCRVGIVGRIQDNRAARANARAVRLNQKAGNAVALATG